MIGIGSECCIEYIAAAELTVSERIVDTHGQ